MSGIEPAKSRVLTVQDLSMYLKVHPSTVYRMLKNKQIPAFRVGSDWRFNVELIDQWLGKLGSPRPASVNVSRQKSTAERRG